MRTLLKGAMVSTLAIALSGMMVVSDAAAQCSSFASLRVGGIELQSWPGVAEAGSASFVLTAAQQSSNQRIVGFWKVKFISAGNTGIGIPDGAVIDNGFAQWHDDGTEIMNSSRDPATGNFCLGVWQKSGPFGYVLNHFALSWTAEGNFIGPAQIRESVALNQSATEYNGTFAIDQYDPAGTLLVHIGGTISATRITVDTAVSDVL